VRPIVCYVTDRTALGSADPAETLLPKIHSAIAAGVEWVQIRERSLPVRELLAFVRAAIRISINDVRVIVNDRFDVAIAAGAAGVHLGRESAPAREVVRWCRSGNVTTEFLVGVSCHSLEEVREAEGAGASYVAFGPVFDTPSKRGFGEPQGIARLAEVCRSVRLPVIAIGGVNEKNGEGCLRAGAAGIAAIRLFQESREAGDLKRSLEYFHRIA
jgi:thiamine-phosphate pyrophosphorylase